MKLVRESINDKSDFDWNPEPTKKRQYDRKGLSNYIIDHISKTKMKVTDEDRHKVEDKLMEDPEFNTILKKIILTTF